MQALPLNASPEKVRAWLIEMTRFIGPGFHPDTPFGDYVNRNGRSFDEHTTSQFDWSMDLVFDLLGHDEPYEICLSVVRELLSSQSAA